MRGSGINVRRNIALHVAAITAALHCPFGQSALMVAQAPRMPGAGTCTFEVVSIHPSKRDQPPQLFHKGDGTILTAINTSPLTLLRSAFRVRDKNYFAGYPNWVETESYDIIAKVPTSLGPTHCLADPLSFSAAVKGLVLERLALRYHTENRLIKVYALSIAKGGVKLKPSTAGPDFITKYPDGQYWYDDPPSARVIYGSMAKLTAILRGAIGHEIIDKTGMSGHYDFTLKWEQLIPNWTPPGWPVYKPENDPNAGPPIYTAVKEQLGLELKPIKVMVPVTVIDHIERPSPN